LPPEVLKRKVLEVIPAQGKVVEPGRHHCRRWKGLANKEVWIILDLAQALGAGVGASAVTDGGWLPKNTRLEVQGQTVAELYCLRHLRRDSASGGMSNLAVSLRSTRAPTPIFGIADFIVGDVFKSCWRSSN
jgi:hypothetical protein